MDFILGDVSVAIEVKLSEQVHHGHLKGLIAFCEEHTNAKPIVVSMDKRPREVFVDKNRPITILPCREFLQQLWDGEIID